VSFRTNGNYIELKTDYKNHLVIITPGFPAHEQDTTCIPALQIFIRDLSIKYRGKISIITFQYPYFSGIYKWNNLDIYALGGRNKKIRKYAIWRRAKILFKQLNKQQKVTQLHSFWMGECAFIGSEIATKFQVPHLCTLMGQDVLPNNIYFKKLVQMPELVTLSQYHHNVLKKNYNLESSIIPWGIESPQHFVAKKDIDVIGVGSLIPLKCFNELIMMMGQISDIYPNIICKIVGDGPLKDSLSQQIKRQAMTENVEILGAKSYEETQKLIARSRILVHLSDFESFGMVIIEAMRQQARVISKPVGIANEMESVVKINSLEEALVCLEEMLMTRTLPQSMAYPIETTVQEYLLVFGEAQL
jgi:glycosyltransferase involved in cell wall biosynthesis